MIRLPEVLLRLNAKKDYKNNLTRYQIYDIVGLWKLNIKKGVQAE